MTDDKDALASIGGAHARKVRKHAILHLADAFAMRWPGGVTLRVPPHPVRVVFQFVERTAAPCAHSDFVDLRRDFERQAMRVGDGLSGLPCPQLRTGLHTGDRLADKNTEARLRPTEARASQRRADASGAPH